MCYSLNHLVEINNDNNKSLKNIRRTRTGIACGGLKFLHDIHRNRNSFRDSFVSGQGFKAPGFEG